MTHYDQFITMLRDADVTFDQFEFNGRLYVQIEVPQCVIFTFNSETKKLIRISP
jgi:hypothetical protein